MRHTSRLWCAAAVSTLLTAGAQQLPPPGGALQTIVERTHAPDWIALPSYGQLQVPAGVKLELVHAVVVSRSHPREAVLVGAFRNRGVPLKGVRVTLRYLSSDDVTLEPIAENAAAVSSLADDGLLPFRFALASSDQLSGVAAIYRLVVDTDLPERFRQLRNARVEITRTRALAGGRGASVTGTFELGAGHAQVTSTDVTLTLLLMDDRGRVLDVIVERPFRPARIMPAGEPWPFEIRSAMPISKPVRDVKAWIAVSR